MTSSAELIRHLKDLQELAMQDMLDNDPHGDDRFRHIYYMGKVSAITEALDVLSIKAEGEE